MKFPVSVPVCCFLLPCLGLSALPPGSSHPQSAPVGGGFRHGNIYVEIPELPLDALVLAASNVIYGKVLGSRPVFPARGMPYTEYELQVYAAFKGAVSERTSIGVGGASSAEQQVTLVDAPHFAVGEEVVVLTWSGTSELPPGILGLGLGTYRIGLDPEGEMVARRDRPGVVKPLGEFFFDLTLAVERAQESAQEEK